MAKKSKKSKVKVGDRFDKLTVIEQVDMPIEIKIKNENGETIKTPTGRTKIGWLCKCDCGEKITLPESTLLKTRNTLRSCNKCLPEKNPNHISNKMTFEDKQEWDELYEYVKKNIFNLDESQALPNEIRQRLLGLSRGKYMANNQSANNAKYSNKTVLNTFKFCCTDIQRALRNNNFKNEQHKFNYIAKIIENNINDVYKRMKDVEKSKKEIENTDISHTVEYINTFKKKENKKTNNRLNELW